VADIPGPHSAPAIRSVDTRPPWRSHPRKSVHEEGERPRFVTVVRGYDRIEVDEHMRATRREMAGLRAELVDCEDRRWLAERRADALEGEVGELRSQLTAHAPDGGFGLRAERLLRLAEQEASEVRASASLEAATTLQEARAEAERHRHEVEQSLISRSATFDERAARRSGELQRWETQIAEQLAAAKAEAQAVEEAARRAADQYRERVEAEAGEIRARAATEALQSREHVALELVRLAELQDGVRAEIARLCALLSEAASVPTSAAGRVHPFGETTEEQR
jgi:cell division septum initiation protein DivIVA